MDRPEGLNRHYLPEWLLKKFRMPNLYELDIYTGKAEPRKPKKAASEQGLWPQDIEDNVSVHDNQAARIFRNKIDGQKRISLTDDERYDFALWMAQFGVRVPNTREDLRKMLAEEKVEPKVSIEVVREWRSQILQRIRDRNPRLYDDTVRRVGKSATEACFIDQVEKYVRSGRFKLPSHEQVHHQFMRDNSSKAWARILCNYDWVWLRSRYPFVIGDNPLVRWNPKRGRWNYGINREDVEITMPLGLNLCLLLCQGPRIECEYLIDCNERQTRLYNCRQRLAAVKYVYGNSPDIVDFINDPIVGWQPESAGETQDPRAANHGG